MLRENVSVSSSLLTISIILKAQGIIKYQVLIHFLHLLINHYLEVMNCADMKVKMIKVQKNMFVSEKRELTKGEYECLIDTSASMGNEQLALIIQTLGSTGIRISELKSVTLESVIRA